jgi:outer membrane protein TolC
LPFFDRNSGNRQRAQGELLIAQSELRAAESGVSAEIVSAVRAYRALVESYAGSVGAAVADGNGLHDLERRGDSVATIAAVAYREGAIPLFELLDAERARTDVRASALRAAAELHMARIDLLRALGLPIDGARLLPAPH